jgi:hypothetical protein
MQTGTRHDFRLAPENPGRGLLHIHHLEETKLPSLVIEKKIDV